MKSSTDASKPKQYCIMEWKVLQNIPLSILLLLLVFSSISLLFILQSSTPFSAVEPKHGLSQDPPPVVNRPSDNEQVDNSTIWMSFSNSSSSQHNESLALSRDDTKEECDLFVGKWVPEPRGSIYTNWTCPMLPDSKNCGKYGKGIEHILWKWKPDGCELPRFDPTVFLSIVKGKKMALVGDSLARNQMESLLCLLSQAETATKINKEASDKFQTWHYPSHDFTLMVIWAEFLVDRTERMANGTGTGTFDLHLDRVNPIWAEKLPGLGYLIISGGNWLFKKSYYYENDNLIGCFFCPGENITHLGTAFAIRRIFRTSLQFISRCEECDGLVALLRTYSPDHFEHGSWYSGGYCNRTQPLNESEVDFAARRWDFRMIQLEEMEKIKEEWKGRKKLELLDVTKAMMLRSDGHPDSFFNRKGSSIASDCLHWCLPGPIDMWNDVLLATLKKNSLFL